MKTKNKSNRNLGFTIMEVLLALFIIGILLLIITPIATTKIEKNDEYSYYLAYRSIEKMAGHIVALGDPEEDSVALKIDENRIAQNNKLFGFFEHISSKYNPKATKKYFANLGYKFANSELYIFKKLFPKAMALVVTEEIGVWASEDFDTMWLTARVCSGHQVVEYTTPTTTKYFVAGEDIICPSTPSEYLDIFSKGECLYSEDQIASIYNALANDERPNAAAYCVNSYRLNCNKASSSYEITYNTTTESPIEEDEEAGEDAVYNEDAYSAEQGYCKLEKRTTLPSSFDGSATVKAVTPTFSTSWCSEHDFVNMTNQAATTSIDCVCKSGLEQTENNEKVCFEPCSSTTESLYAVANSSGGYSRLCCSTDFNSSTGKCCPANSFYNESSEKCECQANYEAQSDGSCKLETCPLGSHKSADGYCIINPPIVKAKRFCELIKSNWNTTSASCDFTSYNNGNYNQAVYKAIMGTDNELMSIKSQDGAFNKITPNIVLDNGLKLWILADKSATIFGLSYYSPTPKLNMCSRINLSDHSETACNNAGGYYCKSQANCFKLADGDSNVLRDARTCCPSYDMTDVQEAAEEQGLNWKQDGQAYAISGFTVFVDINGSKGNGTLWEDVFPFYIATNGTVYPAYPLNSPKGLNEQTSLYTAGNSDTYLPTDVYYNQSSGDDLKRVIAFPNVSYARALCSARNLSQYTPYCLNLGAKYSNSSNDKILKGAEYLTVDDPSTSTNPCDTHTCYVVLKKKKILW